MASAWVRTLQWFGLIALVASAFLPTLQLRAFPGMQEVGGPWAASTVVVGAPEVPCEVLGGAVADAAAGRVDGCPLWHARRWYPWYLVLIWLPALWAVRGTGPTDRRRRWVGAGLWGLTLVILAFEAAYLRGEYDPLLPGGIGRAETFLAWVVVALILLYRRRGDRHAGAVEATVASQALLGFAHALTLPGTMARAWVGAFPHAAVAKALWINFPPAFWTGTAGMLLMALPVYFARKGSTAPPS